MPELSGHYEFTILSDASTRIDFKINADAGGWLPSWVTKMITRDIPFNTLNNLRTQVKRTKGRARYRPFVKRAKAKVSEIQNAADPSKIDGVVKTY